MRIHIRKISSIAILLAAAFVDGNAFAQQVFYEWIETDPVANWNDPSRWEGNTLNFVPDVDQAPGESARIGNGRVAFIDQSFPTLPRIAELDVENGVVEIRQNGELLVVASGDGVGDVSTGGAGTVRLLGNGQLSAQGSFSNLGTLRLTGPNAGVQIDGDLQSLAGTIGANITDANNHGPINVAGEANLGGTLRVSLSGFNPSFGQSWNVVTAGTLTGGFDNTVVESAPLLGRGLQIRGSTSGNNATVEVDNTLVLTVNRQSGATAIHNVVGDSIEITSYAVRSANGLLNPASWTELSVGNQAGTGWVNANPTTNALAELNLEDSHSILLNDTLTLGNPYAGSMALGPDEDVVFEYSTASGELRTGLVEYEGIPNDLTLFVDPSDGSVAMGNLSPFLTPPQVVGYSIGSENNQLTTANWDSFSSTGEAGAGWETASPTSSALTELNLEGMKAFTNGTLISLGEIFVPDGMRDLTFQYINSDGQFLNGTVQYGAIPIPPEGVPGDYNGDGFVNAADYVFWRDANGATGVPAGTGADGDGDTNVTLADYNFWRQQFGGSAGSGSGAFAASVPEPASIALVLCGLMIGIAFRGTRRV